MVSSFLNRPPARRLSRPFLTTHPPCHSSWSSYPRGYPWPGRVSTLLNQTYSVPARLVHACLQVTEQVWHPMHLSRFITMPIWAITRTSVPPSDGGFEAQAQSAFTPQPPIRPTVVEVRGAPAPSLEPTHQ